MWRGPLRRLTIAITVCALCLAAPALASANPSSGAVKPSVHLSLPDSFVVLGHPVTVPGRLIHLAGVIRPYVAGQRVAMAVLEGKRIVKRAWVHVAQTRPGQPGRFSVPFKATRVGAVKLLVGHLRTAQMGRFKVTVALSALDEHVKFGSTGRFVVLIQQRLAALHFYVPQTGVYDAGTGLALDAYHRLLHWGTSQTLDGRTISYLLDGFGAFKVRFPSHGRHAEANLSLQLLALIDGSRVEQIEPTSSGKPSTPTVLGDYRVYLREPGYNSEGMYYSDYFIRGYAIHGYNPAPDYPASHGCIRIPIADAIPTFNWLSAGDWVDVYY